MTAFPIALEALICSLLFSKCSAKDYALSLILTGGISIYFRVANHPVEFPTKFNQHNAFVGTDPTKCPQLPSDPSSDRNCGFDCCRVSGQMLTSAVPISTLSDGGSITPCLAEVLRLSKL